MKNYRFSEFLKSSWFVDKADNIQTQEFLKRGTVISIKHPNILEPIVNVIQKVEGRNVFFRMTEEILKNKIFRGDKIVFEFMHNGYDYFIDGMISEIEIKYPRLVHVYIDNVYKIKNNREEKRYLVSLQTDVIVNIPRPRSIYAVVKNISSTGMGLVSNDIIPIDDKIRLITSLSIEKDDVIDCKAQIMRMSQKNNIYEYGAKIIQMNYINKRRFRELLFKLEEDQSNLIANYLK